MDTLILIFEILLLVAGLFLVGAVLMQQGKAHGLSGAIAGGAETFFGKEKGKRFDRIISRWTTVVGIVFVVIVMIVFILMPDVKMSDKYTTNNWSNSPYYSTTETEIVEED